ncbi:unnamed protein product, partial [Acanthoscelides obtectus]
FHPIPQSEVFAYFWLLIPINFEHLDRFSSNSKERSQQTILSIEDRRTKLLQEVPLIDGHNDLPWNIRKFLHNKLKNFKFNEDLRSVSPWSTSAWSHTDLVRLQRGHVAAQEILHFFYLRVENIMLPHAVQFRKGQL